MSTTNTFWKGDSRKYRVTQELEVFFLIVAGFAQRPAIGTVGGAGSGLEGF
jgi:hypothetical protein